MDINLKLNRARLMTSAATGLALLFVAGPMAVAQEADEPVEAVDAAAEEVADDSDERTLNVVTVTGYRQSIQNSIATKRASDLIVEAVSAEDIGKLPDNSITESLARLPGLTAQRLFGRAQVISVRGLGPDFTTALLNGREQVTAGDNRAVEFDLFPSEIITQGVVYKTPDAELMGQGLAGTVDLRTARPLSYSDRKVSLGARYEQNQLGALNAGSDDTGYRLTASYIDQFANDTFGVALAGALQTSPTQSERFEAWGYPTTGTGAFIIGGAKPYVESRTLERTALMGTFQYEPVGAFSTTVDLFYSNFQDNGVLRGIEIPLAWGSGTLQPNPLVQDGFVEAGIFTNVRGIVRNDDRSRDVDVFSAGWNSTLELNDLWTAEADLSFSKVERADIDLETYSGLPPATAVGDTIRFQRNENGGFVFGTAVNYADPNVIRLTDPGGWGQVGFIKEPSTDDQLSALRLSLSRDLDGAISSVDVGLNYSDREKTKRSEEAFLDLASGAASVAIPTNLLQSPTELRFLGIGGQVSYDPQALLASGVYRIRPNTNPDVVTKAWDVQETVLTGYIKANVDSEFYGMPVKGNFGVQIVETEQASQGARVGRDGTGAVRIVNVDLGDKYTNVLPSANFSFDLGEDMFFRTGIARTLARARLDQIRASQEFGIDSSLILFPGELTDSNTGNNTTSVNPAAGRAVFNPSGGNPALRPYLADSFDVSLEKYFGEGGYITAAMFYKDLKDFVYDGARTQVDYSSVLNAATILDPVTNLPVTAAQLRALNPGIDTGILSQPENGEGGFLRGVELATSIPGELFLPKAFSGLGLLASVSFTDSSVTPRDEPKGIEIPGLSKTVGNVTLFYEQSGFEARVSNRFRSDFLGEVTGFGAGRELRTVKGESVIDAQIGYNFTSGPIEGLSVVLQGNNLTNEPFTTIINGDERLVRDYQEYGTTYLLGVNFKF